MLFVNAFRAARTRYQHALRERPLTTNILQSFLLWTLGDAMSQSVERLSSVHEKVTKASSATDLSTSTLLGTDVNATDLALSGEATWKTVSTYFGRPFDLQRCATTGLYGAMFIGPVGHQWYKGLDYLTAKIFSPKSTGMSFLVTKVALDTLIFGPVHVAAFFSWMKLMRGGSLDELRRKLDEDFLPTFLADSIWWVPIQLLNFRYVPVPIQLTVVNIACVFESAGLSFLNNVGWGNIFQPVYVQPLP